MELPLAFFLSGGTQVATGEAVSQQFYIVGSKIRLPSSCSMPLCKGSKPAQYSIREIFFIRLVSSCAILFASKVVEKL